MLESQSSHHSLFRTNAMLIIDAMLINNFTWGKEAGVSKKLLLPKLFETYPPWKVIGGFEFCHNLYMNYRKYTYESDFESQKDALYCGNNIFSYQVKKNVNNKTLLPLGL